MNDDSADVPKTNAHAIRRGMPKALSPAGAFDAVVRKNEGIYIRYLGIPLEPWVHFDSEFEFADVPRTFDPALFPTGTPKRFTQFAPDPDEDADDAPLTLAEAEALSKAKKKAKKKHGHA